LHDLVSGATIEEIQVHSAEVTSISRSPSTLASQRNADTCADGQQLLTNSKDRTLKIFDVRTMRELNVLKSPEFKPTLNYNTACFSRCGKFAAAGGADGITLIWEIDTGKVKRTLKSPQSDAKSVVTCVAWSPLQDQGNVHTLACLF
jgi:WD40 repeat protein